MVLKGPNKYEYKFGLNYIRNASPSKVVNELTSSVKTDEKPSASFHLLGEEFRLVSPVALVSLWFKYVSTATELDVLSCDLFKRLLELFQWQKLSICLQCEEVKQVAGLKSVTFFIIVNASKAHTLIINFYLLSRSNSFLM